MKKKPNISFNLNDFSDLDNSDKADFLIHSMETHYRLDSMRSIKKRAVDMLDIKTNDNIIELGCGLGLDAEVLGQLANEGTVTAVDISKRMLKEAVLRSRCKNVVYEQGDVNALSYDDNSFSKCRLERLLISQKNINKVFKEAKRITKPGGKICITDLDFSTIFIYPIIGKINKLIIEHWFTLVKNPLIARSLPFLFLQNKMTDLKLQPEIFIVRSYETLKEIVEFEVMLGDIQTLGKISDKERKNAIKAFQQADIEGKFFWSINLLSIAGTKTAD